MKAGMTNVWWGRVSTNLSASQKSQRQSIIFQGALLSAGWHYPPSHLPFPGRRVTLNLIAGYGSFFLTSLHVTGAALAINFLLYCAIQEPKSKKHYT